MTYSIVGADPRRDEVGVAVQSKFLAVGALVPWAQGGVGAVAVQAFPDVTAGPRALAGLARGEAPGEVLAALLADDELRAQRQIGVVAADGRAASHTGEDCFEAAASVTGQGFAAQGNVLTSAAVPQAMAEAFTTATGGPLAQRLLVALEAGQAAGGERRGMESAALVVRKPGGGYGGNHDLLLDLRVDHADDPIAALRGLYDLHDLYFGATPRERWVPLDAALRDEVRARLAALGWTGTLQSWMGWENLEERWVGEDHVDPVVLDQLRARAS